jgi:TetR/AcrR family transcriptional regulator, regulator of biofilm formation and stress response
MAAADRRSALIGAALRVMARDGVAAATTRAIVAEADMPLASFHYVFSSHAEMMRQVMTFVVEQQIVDTEPFLSTGEDARSTIRRALLAYLESIIAHPEQIQVSYELLQYAMRRPELEHLVREQYERYRAGQVMLLTAADETNNFSWTVPIEELAHLMVTFIDGLTFGWLAQRDTEESMRLLDVFADLLTSLTTPRDPTP